MIAAVARMVEIFALLFIAVVLLVNDIVIKPSPKKLSDQEYIILKNIDNDIFYFVSKVTNKITDIKLFKNPTRDELYIDSIDCELNEECKNYLVPQTYKEKGLKKHIMLTGELNRDATQLIANATLTFPLKSSNVQYRILESGEIDREYLIDRYPFFKQIFIID
jgi:hypothetical protein